jgi:hypothetical protein
MIHPSHDGVIHDIAISYVCLITRELKVKLLLEHGNLLHIDVGRHIQAYTILVLWCSQYYRLSMCVIFCSPDYNGCATQCEQSNTMLSINLFTFVMPRDARSGDTVPVIVILHGSHVLQQSTIEALLNGTVGCTPMHFGGQGTNYAAVTLHPIYSAFLRMSSKLMGPDVDRNLN